MNIKGLLPIGSVVLLKDAEKKLMITGILQIDNETGKEYDYLSVPYPEGYISDENQFLFNRNDIQEVYFVGYNENERAEFLNNLDEYYKKEGLA